MENLERVQPAEGETPQATGRATHPSVYEGHMDKSSNRAVPIGDLISVETVVNVLLRKGVCSEEELLAEERRHRDSEGQFYKVQYLSVDEHGHKAGRWGRPQHPLRKMFSKFRWTRRLGTAIFGWKWKKVRRTPLEEERFH